jgi:hypothetical protein
MPKTAFRIYNNARACDRPGCWKPWPCLTHGTKRTDNAAIIDEHAVRTLEIRACNGCGYIKCSCPKQPEVPKEPEAAIVAELPPDEMPPGWVRDPEHEQRWLRAREERNAALNPIMSFRHLASGSRVYRRLDVKHWVYIGARSGTCHNIMEVAMLRSLGGDVRHNPSGKIGVPGLYTWESNQGSGGPWVTAKEAARAGLEQLKLAIPPKTRPTAYPGWRGDAGVTDKYQHDSGCRIFRHGDRWYYTTSRDHVGTATFKNSMEEAMVYALGHRIVDQSTKSTNCYQVAVQHQDTPRAAAHAALMRGLEPKGKSDGLF